MADYSYETEVVSPVNPPFLSDRAVAPCMAAHRFRSLYTHYTAMTAWDVLIDSLRMRLQPTIPTAFRGRIPMSRCAASP